MQGFGNFAPYSFLDLLLAAIVQLTVRQAASALINIEAEDDLSWCQSERFAGVCNSTAWSSKFVTRCPSAD